MPKTVVIIGGGVVGLHIALALAYRARPVFVPTTGPNDPVARYRTAVLARLRLIAIGVPLVVGALAGLVAQSYWVRVQLFLHGGEFGVTDPQFGKDLAVPATLEDYVQIAKFMKANAGVAGAAMQGETKTLV